MFPNLRAEMARKKLPAAAIASKLKLSTRTLNNKLSGKTEFKWSEILKIHSFFPDCTLDYLFAEQESATA